MDRKDFLTAIGMGAASVAVFNCIGCSKGDSDTNGSPSPPVSPPTTGINFVLDLTASSNSALKTNGGFIYKDDVIIAKTTTGEYIAVSKFCRHENAEVVYRANNNHFYCPRHGNTYSNIGVSAGQFTNLPLIKYNTELDGTSLRVYS